MRPSVPFRNAILTVAAASCLLGAVAEARADMPPPALDHVIVIVMENKNYDVSRVQPYTASLIASYTSFSNSFGVAHPSQPNYLALWSGSTQGVINDICPPAGSPYSAENLGQACEAAGVSWRAYSEDFPTADSSACTADGTLYTRKHDPWSDFSNLDHANERPYYFDFLNDLAAGTLPRLSFVIPNNCHNSHDNGCTAAYGDNWLSLQVPAMLDAIGPNGMLVLTWDEDDGAEGNHVLTVFAGPKVKPGYVSTDHLTHLTLLRALCDVLGVPPVATVAGEPQLTDVWNDGVVPVARTSWGRVKTIYR